MSSFVKAARGLVSRFARAFSLSRGVGEALWVAPLAALILGLTAAPGAASAQATCTIDFGVGYNAANVSHVMSMTVNFDEFAACDPRYVANPGDVASGFAPYVQSGATANGGSFTTQVNPADNTLRYTAPNGFSGVDNFTVYFCNDGACSDAGRRTATVLVTVGTPTVVVNPDTLPAATVAIAYDQTLTGSGGQAPYRAFTVISGALPTGLTLSAGGALAGAPTASGVFNFTIRTTDSTLGTGPFSGSRAYAMTVNTPTITVGPTVLPDGVQGGAYAQTIVAAGGAAPRSFAVTSGGLPAGLTLAAGGGLAGTPTVSGTFNFTITATDSSTGTGPSAGSRAYSLVIAPPAAPTISGLSVSEGAANAAAAPANTTIAGAGFSASGNSVSFGGVPAVIVSESSTSIVVTPPARAAGGLVNVVVTSAASQAGTAVNAYRYLLPPTVTVSWSPDVIVGSQTTTFTLTVTNPNGVGLNNVAVASSGANTPFTLTAFGTICGSGNYNASSAFSLTGFPLAANATCTVTSTQASASAGTYQFVTNAPTSTGTATTSVSLRGAPATSNAITVHQRPSIGSVTPNNGPLAGGAPVTITGSAFTAVTGVTIDGVAATNVTVVSSTSITATTPAGATVGGKVVAVTNTAGTGTRANAYQYNAPPAAPTISAPASGGSTPATPVYGGTSVAGSSATVTVRVDGVTVGTATPAGNGVWSLQQPTALSAGSHTVSATTTTSAGGTSAASSAVTFTVDVTPPAAPTITVPADNAVIAQSAQTVSGAAESGSTVTLRVDGAVAGSVVATGGSWSANLNALAEGPHAVSAFATDAAGNISPESAATTFRIDATAPGAPTIATPANGAATADNTPTISGTAEPGSSLTLSLNGGVIGVAGAPGGAWSFTLPELADDAYTISATATDAVGNVSPASSPVTFTIDATAPAAPLITAPADGSTTGDDTPLLSGSAEDGSTVTVFLDGVAVGTTPANGGGWSLISATLADGPHTLSATATDAVGNASPRSTTAAFTVDVTAPDAPRITTPADGSAINEGRPLISGTAEPDARVRLSINGGPPVALVADLNGDWSHRPVADLPAGPNTLTATATDGLGNGSPVSDTVRFTYSPITISTAGLPAGQVGVAYAATITATGGAMPYAFAVTAGALPDGISLSATGALSGAPTASGAFAVTVTATDGDGLSASQAYTVTIAAPAAPGAASTTVQAPATASNGPTSVDLSGQVENAASIEIVSPPAQGSVTVNGFSVVYTPQPGFYGTVAFRYRAIGFANGGPGAASAPAAVTIVIAGPTLALPGGALPNGQIAAAYSQMLAASGGTAPYTYAVTAGALPTGITLASDGRLSGSPTAGGVFSFTVTASDSSTGEGPFSIAAAHTLTIDAATLAVTPTALPNATVAQAYAAAFSTSGGVAPYSYAVTGGALPTGLTLSPSGGLSGTPTQGGAFAFTVTATDASTGAGPYSASQAVTLTVAGSTIAVSPASLPGGTRGTAYSQTVAASGGVAPYRYTIASGALPAGLTLSTAGQISGTPTVTGTFVFQVRATDSASGAGPYSGAADLTLTIASAALTVTPTSLPDVLAGVAYSQQLQASGGRGGYRFAITAGALPDGLALSPAGLLSGEPTTAGAFAFTVTATDGFGNTGVALLGLTVTARPDPAADPDIRGLNTAQAEATRRMLGAQIGAFSRRLEHLHRGGEGEAGAALNLTLDGSAFTPLDQGRRTMGGLDQARGRDDRNEGDVSGRAELNRMVWGDRTGPEAGTAAAQGRLNAGARDVADAVAPSGPRIWAGGAISLGERDATTQTAEMSITTSGISAGVDLSLAENLDLGIGVGFGQENTDVGSDSSRMEAASRVAVAYGSWRPTGDVFIDGMLGYGALDFDLRRRTPVDRSEVSGDRDGAARFGSLSAGLDRTMGPARWIGYGRIELLDADLDAYVETGSPLWALSYEARSVESVQGALGLRYEQDILRRSGRWTPGVRAEWTREFGDAGAQTLRYADWLDGPGYAIGQDGWARSRFNLGVSLGWVARDGWFWSGEYDGAFSNGEVMNGLRIRGGRTF